MTERQSINPSNLKEVRHRYQKDPVFQNLIDQGIGKSLPDSGFCWAACADMAFSAFIPNSSIHENVMRAFINELKANVTFNEKGEFNMGENGKEFVNATMKSAGDHMVPLEAKIINEPTFNDFHEHLEQGDVLIFGLTNKEGSHVLVMDT